MSSKEGHEFIVSKECANASGTIRTMLTGPGIIHAIHLLWNMFSTTVIFSFAVPDSDVLLSKVGFLLMRCLPFLSSWSILVLTVFQLAFYHNIGWPWGSLRCSYSGTWKETAGPMASVHFEDISTNVLEKIVQYFYFKQRYDNSTTPIPKFEVSLDALFSTLLAANFLDA